MRSEILADDAVPATAVFVHLCFEVAGEHALLFVLLEALLETGHQDLLDFVDLFGVHVRCFYFGFHADVCCS